MTGNVLAPIVKARKALSLLKTPGEVKDHLNKAEAIRNYYAKQRGCLDAANDAAEYMIWARRRLGELFREIPRDSGGRPRKNSVTRVTQFSQAAEEIGVTTQTVKHWQQESDIPESEVLEYMAATRLAQKQITAEGVRKLGREPRDYAPEQLTFDPPEVCCASWEKWLPKQPDCDLLLTDPPYMTDVDNVWKFAEDWLPEGLAKVKPTGRAYIFIGAYPDELAAYLVLEPPDHLILPNVLVWTYRNTLGQMPSHHYKQNWQAILYYQGIDAPELNVPQTRDQFSVFEINAPDGRLGDRCHAWQKPENLSDIFIQHASQTGDLVLDPFCCTATFLLSAARFGRVARGCDISRQNLRIAQKRGCKLTRC